MTLATQAYTQIRQDIIRGKLAPGAPLRLAELKEAYHMGFSPLREALNRLQAERLVDAVELRGFRVAPWSVEEMQDAIATRTEIEESALRAAIRLGDDNYEAAIIAALHALNRQADRMATEGGDIWELEQRHHQFHRALIAACGSPWKLEFFEQLYTVSERYRVPILLRQGGSGGRDIRAEHAALAEAVIARRADEACALLRSHYRKSAQWITSAMQDYAAAG